MARFFFLWVVGLSVVIAFCIQCLGQLPDGKLHIFFLDIGQGDAMLMVTPDGNRVLIDVGPPGVIGEPLRRAIGWADNRIDLMILTQYDQDHAGGALALIDQFDVRQALVLGAQQGTSLQLAIGKKMREKSVPVWIGYRDTDFWLDREVFMDVLWPAVSMAGRYVPKVNESSLVSRIVVGGRPVLLSTADIGFVAEQKLLALGGSSLRADILKVGHHGSKFSSSDAFLRAVTPLWSVISVGARNRYGHPTEEALGRLRAIGGEILRTDTMGTVEMVVEVPGGEVVNVVTERKIGE